MTRLLCPTLIVILLLSALSPGQGVEPTPPAAPTSVCTVTPRQAHELLRVFTGDGPVPYVFACGIHAEKSCLTSRLNPGKEILPTSVTQVDHEESRWSCIFFDGVAGWVPSDRLAPLPVRPTVPVKDWLGWYRSLQTPGKKSNQLLLTRGTSLDSIRVSGRAYWFGIDDNVHFGQVNGEAVPFGRYLRIVTGDDESSCALDLAADPINHSYLIASDNSHCGGMNVRFQGKWRKFNPNSSARK